VAQVRVKVLAQVATDANGRAYESILIPEPKSWEKWFQAQQALGKVERSRVGADPDLRSPMMHKAKDGREKAFDSIQLKRGGEPVELTMPVELYRQLKNDRKNLNLFGMVEIEEDGKPKAAKA